MLKTYSTVIASSFLINFIISCASFASDNEDDAKTSTHPSSPQVPSVHGPHAELEVYSRAIRGDGQAQLNMGIVERDSWEANGSPAFYSEAQQHLTKAAKQGNQDAEKALGDLKKTSLQQGINEGDKNAPLKDKGKDKVSYSTQTITTQSSEELPSGTIQIQRQASTILSRDREVLIADIPPETIEYDKLTEKERNKLFKQLDLQKAINLTVSSGEGNIERSWEKGVIWTKHPDWRSANEDLKVQTSYSYTETYHELNKLGISKVTSGLSYLGIGGAITEYESKEAKLEAGNEIDIFLLSTWKVPKGELRLKENYMMASSELEDKVASLVGKVTVGETNEKDIDSYKKLLGLFEEYGFCVPTRFVLGGKIFSESKQSVRSIKEANEVKKEFEASVNASYQGASASIGARAVQAEGTDARKEQRVYTFTTSAMGGDAYKIKQPYEWVESVTPINKWKVIERNNFIPIINLFNEDLRNKCRVLISKFYKGDMKKISLPLLEKDIPFESTLLDYILDLSKPKVKYIEGRQEESFDDILIIYQKLEAERERYVRSLQSANIAGIVLFPFTAVPGKLYNDWIEEINIKLRELRESSVLYKVKMEMERYKEETGVEHPRWKEFANIWNL